jgi:hypothetical protein
MATNKTANVSVPNRRQTVVRYCVCRVSYDSQAVTAAIVSRDALRVVTYPVS